MSPYLCKVRTVSGATAVQTWPRSAGSVQGCLHPHPHKLVDVRALPPPDEDVPLLIRHVDLHETIIYQILTNANQEPPQQPPQNTILFNFSRNQVRGG